jgi:hypothetical protein
MRHSTTLVLVKAVDTLDDLLSEKKHPAVRLGAARTIAEIAMHEWDAETLLKMLEDIEAAQRLAARIVADSCKGHYVRLKHVMTDSKNEPLQESPPAGAPSHCSSVSWSARKLSTCFSTLSKSRP